MISRSVPRAFRKAQEAEEGGRIAEAARLVETILQTAPDHAGARLIRARCWAKKGCLECARQELVSLLDRAPELFEARMSLAATLILIGEYERGVDQIVTAARQCVAEDVQVVLSDGGDSDSSADMRSLWQSYLSASDDEETIASEDGDKKGIGHVRIV